MHDDSLDVGIAHPLVVPEIVTFPAEVTISNSKAVRAALLAAFRPGVSVVIADLRETVFCDAAGVSHLWIAGNHAVCTGSQLRIVVGDGAVRRALHDLGADQTLPLYANMEAALTGRHGPPASAPLQEVDRQRTADIHPSGPGAPGCRGRGCGGQPGAGRPRT